MKPIRIAAAVIHFFVGLGACAGGWAAVLNPASPLGAPSEMLKRGPFENFLIPGLFLLIVIGLGNIISGVLALKQVPAHAYVTGAMGAVLIGWIVIQCYILQAIGGLHIVFFAVGCVQGMIALAELWLSNQFPMPIVRRILRKD